MSLHRQADPPPLSSRYSWHTNIIITLTIITTTRTRTTTTRARPTVCCTVSGRQSCRQSPPRCPHCRSSQESPGTRRPSPRSPVITVITVIANNITLSYLKAFTKAGIIVIGNKYILKESFQCNMGFASFSFFMWTLDDIKVCRQNKFYNLSYLACKPAHCYKCWRIINCKN